MESLNKRTIVNKCSIELILQVTLVDAFVVVFFNRPQEHKFGATFVGLIDSWVIQGSFGFYVSSPQNKIRQTKVETLLEWRVLVVLVEASVCLCPTFRSSMFEGTKCFLQGGGLDMPVGEMIGP